MFRIVTDSSCDLSQEVAARMGIDRMLPMKVSFGNDDYYDGVTISPEEFYQKLKEDKYPARTALISVGDFEKAFYDFRHDDILVVSLSSKLSGTCRSAEIAVNLSERSNITIVDTQAGSGAQAIMLNVACKMRELGAGVDSVAKKLRELVPRLRIYAAVDMLRYMIRGGRISKAAGAVAGFLNIKPIIALRDGALTSYRKTKGMNAALRALKTIAVDEDGIDPDYPVYLCHSMAPEWTDQLKEQLPPLDIREILMGTTIGSHAGPGTVEIAFVAAE